MMFRLTFLLLAVLLISSCRSFRVEKADKETTLYVMGKYGSNGGQFRVEPVSTNDVQRKEGVFYFLPKTLLQVDVTVRETRFLKGPYAQYSAKFTGISNVITENSSKYSIEGLSVSSMSMADTSKLYYIYTRGWSKKLPFQLTLCENGCIAGFNVPEQSVIAGYGEVSGATSDDGNANESETFSFFATENTRIKTDTILERIILDTVTIEKQILQHSIIEKTAEDKARDAADYIKLIAENKMNLIAGYQEVDYNSTTFQMMLAELDKLTKDYLALFTGKTVEYSRHYRFTIDPTQSGTTQPEFLFSFYNNDGLRLEQDSLFTENMYYYEIKAGHTGQRLCDATTEDGKIRNHGLFYNIPADATLIITNGNGNVVFSQAVSVAQMGVVMQLPASMRKVLFVPASGGIKQLAK